MYVHTSAKGVGFNDPLQCPETASLVNSAGRLHKPFLHIPPSSQNSPAPLKKRPSPKENARHPIGGKSGQQGFNKRESLGRGKGEALGADAQLSKPEIGNLVRIVDELVAEKHLDR